MRFPRLIKKDNAAGAEFKIRYLLLSFLYTAVNGIIGVIMLFNLRNAVMFTVERTNTSVWAFNFIEMASAIILCIAWLIFVFVAQHLYEKDIAKSLKPKRFLLYTAVQLAVIGALFLYEYIIRNNDVFFL